MGGLVIKKAYILAKQAGQFKALADRISHIFFLATPHRGADLAQLLSKILSIAPGSRPFVDDLNRNSLATQSINDEFPHHCQGLQLYSFYETLPIFGKGLIVDKDLATLGYSNERTAYLNADHRDVARYLSHRDANYITVRNALAAAIGSVRRDIPLSRREIGYEHRRFLNSFLGLSDAPVNDLMHADMIRMPGTCEWLLKKEGFQQWRDGGTNKIYWISAQPAAGKSVIAGSVITHLQDLNQECFYYFFKYSNQNNSTINSFLRSIAWQTASTSPSICDHFIHINQEGGELVNLDFRTVWRKLFLEGIFRVRFEAPQYWVIDALDECRESHELVQLLLRIEETYPVRILLTCRDQYDTYRERRPSVIKVVLEPMTAEDTKADISLYIGATTDLLPRFDARARRDMYNQVLKKSAGSFLWVSLILLELRQAQTMTEVHQALGEAPSGMDEMYTRILDSMSKAVYGKGLAKAMLTWVVCSVRPLTTDELHYALELDIEDTVAAFQDSISRTCGHLIYIDPQSRVQMVHQTAQDFLLRPDIISEFAINKELGNARLTLACLKYLCGDEMKIPRHRKLSPAPEDFDRSPFAHYACRSLSKHIACLSSTEDDILIALTNFLSSYNVLSWIEYLAETSNLGLLIETGKGLRAYLQRRSRPEAILGEKAHVVDLWSIDLIRLVTMFGRYLSEVPSSIYGLIPPFFPRGTALKNQFAASTGGFAVLGLSAMFWDDCLFSVAHDAISGAIACSENLFAFGTFIGECKIYDDITCQEIHTLDHQGRVKMIEFSDTGGIFVSASVSTIRIWDTASWEQIWKFDLSAQLTGPLSLAFLDEDKYLMAAFGNGTLTCWNLTEGELASSIDLMQDLGVRANHGNGFPISAAFCMGLNLLAVGYRRQDILLWDLKKNTLYNSVGRDGGPSLSSSWSVNSLVFCRAPASALLAVAYSDGELVIFNVSKGVVVAELCANAHALASSPDGRFLASRGPSANIVLYDFETLKLLGCIEPAKASGLQSFRFSNDGLRLVHIAGKGLHVFESAIMSPADAIAENRNNPGSLTEVQDHKQNSVVEKPPVTAVLCAGNREAFLCGREDGSVSLNDAITGEQIEKLFQQSRYPGMIVSIMYDDETSILIIEDSLGHVTARKLVRHSRVFNTTEPIFDSSDYASKFSIRRQILANQKHSLLLISADDRVSLFSIAPDGCALVKTIELEEYRSSGWGNCPTDPDQLILVIGNSAHLYDWQTLERRTKGDGIRLEGVVPQLSPRSLASFFGGTVFAMARSQSPHHFDKPRFSMWETADFTPGSKKATPILKYQPLADEIDCLVGNYKERVVFLHQSGWVCSADADTFNLDNFVRHFFIPSDWLSGQELIMDVSPSGTILFAKEDEVAVIRHGLEMDEYVPSAVRANSRAAVRAGKQRVLGE